VAHRIAAIPMTLGDLQGHSPTASIFKWDFSISCAAFDKISNDSASRGPSAVAKPSPVDPEIALLKGLFSFKERN